MTRGPKAMAAPENSHSALVQGLGFVFQFDRATYALLAAPNALVSIGIEFVDDVSEHHTNGKTINEQDKATGTPTGKPLSNRSVALWKTLSIWLEQISLDSTALKTTEYHLVTNGQVSPNSFAGQIAQARDRATYDRIAADLLSIAGTLRDDLRPFGERVVEAGPQILAALISNLKVSDRVSPHFGGRLEDLSTLRYFAPTRREALFDRAAGWVKKSAWEAAASRKPVIIERLAFDSHMAALVREAQLAPLALLTAPKPTGVDFSTYLGSGFVQQLAWLSLEIDEVQEAVLQFIQARESRVRWTDDQTVSESSIEAFEDDLKTRWKQHFRYAGRQPGTPLDNGRTCFERTMAENHTIGVEALTRAVSCGSYHSLADFDAKRRPEIGWHPDFRSRSQLKKNEDS